MEAHVREMEPSRANGISVLGIERGHEAVQGLQRPGNPLARLVRHPALPSDRAASVAAILLFCAVLLAPLALVDVPPLLDYPNHLARLVVLASGRTDAILSSFYAPRWDIIPDLGIDVVGPVLISVLPIHVAGRLLIAIAVLLPVLGVLAYGRATSGPNPWIFGVGLVAWNGTVLEGFLNFTASIGLALLLAAAWLRWRDDRPVRTVTAVAAGAVALFFCHLLGLLFLGLLIGTHEAAVLWRRRGGWVGFAVGRLLASAIIFAVPLLLYGLSDLHGLGGDAEFLPAAEKLRQTLIPFVNYNATLDRLAALAVVVFLLGCLAKRRLRATLAASLALGLLTVIYLIAPFAYKGTSNLDTRLVIMFGYMLFAGLMPVPPRRAAIGATAVFALIFLLRMGVLAAAWDAHGADVAELRAVIANVPPGSTVMVATGDHPGNARRLSNGLRTDGHMPALLLIERRAWWPLMFDNASQQPIMTREPYRDLASRVGGMLDVSALGGLDLRGLNYLLVIEAGPRPVIPLPAARRLEPVSANEFAALYRVTP